MASLTSSSSSYEQEILKFYEQLEQLRQHQPGLGRQKNYNRATTTKDTDEFSLEMELEKLKSRTARSDTYSFEFQLSRAAAATPTTTSIFHTGLSPDIHFQTRVMDETRRARNQEILAKLQELRMNASIFEARAEKFRGIRKEYEDLVQKYSSQRMFTSMSFNGNDEGVGAESGRVKEDFVMKNHRGLANTAAPSLSISTQPFAAQTQKELSIFMVSTGVNTDISGPVRSDSDHEIEDPRVIGINHTRLPQAHPEMISIRRNESVTPAGTAATAERFMPMPIYFRHNESGDGKSKLIPSESENKEVSYFLHDISSTSESELDLTVTRDREKNGSGSRNPNPKSKQVLIDEPLSDSLSLSLPTPSISIPTKRLTQLLNMTSDSEESSTLSNLNLRLKNKIAGTVDVKTRKTIAMTGENVTDDNITRFRSSNPTALVKAKTTTNKSSRERREILSDSSPTSPSASFIDSNAQNKTPDSVPRDESVVALENIVEAAEQLQKHKLQEDDESDGMGKNEESESDLEGTQADVSKIERENGFIDDEDDKAVKAKSFQNNVVPSGNANFGKSNLVASLMDELEENDKGEKSEAVELEENDAKKAGAGGESEFGTSKEKSFLPSSSAAAIRLKLDYEDSEESEGSERYGRRGVSVTTGNQKTGKDSVATAAPGKDTASLQKKNLSDDDDDFFG